MKKPNINYSWKIALDSVTRNIYGLDKIDQPLRDEIKFALDQIDKDEWFPFARNLLDRRPGISSINLANEAASEFLNHKFNTSNLRVEFGENT